MTIIDHITKRLTPGYLIQQIAGFIKNSPISSLFFVLKNDELIFTGCNPAAEKSLNIDQSKLVGLSIEKAFPEFSNLRISAIFKDIARCSTSWNDDGFEYFNGNTTRFFKMNAFQTSPGRMMAMLTDITEVRKYEMELKIANEELQTTEEELREKNENLYSLNQLLRKQNRQLKELLSLLHENEEKFEQLADHIDDTFFLIEKGKLLYINPAVEKVFGLDRNAIIKNPRLFRNLIYPQDLPDFERLVMILLNKGGSSASRQIRVLNPYRKLHWIWIRLFPIPGKNKKANRVAGIVSDITAQKEIEDELRNAKEKAQESDRLKTALLANLSHEIRTPMNGIIGFSGLLAKNVPDIPVNRQYIDIINRSNDQLLHIIDDLVDISKIESNQLRLDIHAFDLAELMEKIFILYTRELTRSGKTGIELTKDYKPGIYEGYILADELRLKQVLMNLLNNALKFTHSGHIRFGATLEDKTSLKFFVEDTGIGIAPELKEVIFEPFRQADIKPAREYGGTGLGLSISKGLVKLMGGKIGLESTPDQGSVFYFSVPYIPAKTIPKTQQVPDVNFLKIQGKSVLIVEDDDSNFYFLKEVLSQAGMKTIRASDGHEAVEYTGQHSPELIVMDIGLPSMNGLEATKKIRESGNKVPIIAQTAYVITENKSVCLNAGCNDYISKPIDKDLLLKKIIHCFDL
jgi:PAS domain S-box-containing protein